MTRGPHCTIVCCCLILGLLMPLASCMGLDDGAEPVYSIQALTVSAGHPVRGVEDGRLLERAFNEACEMEPDSRELSAMAGNVGERLELIVGVAACPAADPPEVECKWAIEAARSHHLACLDNPSEPTSGSASWQGWKGTLALDLPERTGEYDVSLDCTLGGGPAREVLNRTLFVTYADPLFFVSPAETDWYRLATCWGAGFTANKPETDVVTAMRGSLYRYGQAHWRYGYAAETETPGIYLFQGHEVVHRIDVGGLEPHCFRKGFCRCNWQAMVAEETPCNFGDCYIFSRTLQHIVATLGIGGLIECRECYPVGDLGLGFVTPPESRSLDPRFTGSVECTNPEDPCPAYLFGSHSLLWKDGVYHDATFDLAYDDDANVALWNIGSKAHQVDFIDSTAIMFPTGKAYGSWTFYNLASGLRNLVVPRDTVDGARLTGKVSFDTVASGKLKSTLEATVEVEVQKPGTYYVLGELQKDEKHIAGRPDWWSSHHTMGTVDTDAGSVTEVTLPFSGEEIYQSGEKGPYTLVVLLTDEFVRPMHTGEHLTPEEYDHRDFGEVAAEIESVSAAPRDSDGNGRYEALEVLVQVDPRTEEDFLMQVRLSASGKTILNEGAQYSATSTGPMSLLLDGEAIKSIKEADSLELTIELYGVDDLVALSSQRKKVEAFKPGDFE